MRQHDAGQDNMAFANLSKSIAILQKLADSEPGEARYHDELGRSWNLRGHLRDELRENEQAIPAFKRAIAELRTAITRSPDDNAYKSALSVYLENLGEQYVDLGDVISGLPYYLEARDYRRQLRASHPKATEYSQGLGDALLKLGALYRQAGELTSAHATFVAARGHGIARGTPRPMTGSSNPLAVALTQESESLADLKQPDEALELLGKSIGI